MRPRNIACVLGTVCLALVPSVAHAGDGPGGDLGPCGPVLDDFSRANGTDLGPNWTELAQNYAIAGGKVSQPLRSSGVTLLNNVTSTDACVDVFSTNSGQQLEDGGLVLGFGGPGNGITIKVQNDTTAAFDHIYVFQGVPGAGSAVLLKKTDMSAFGSIPNVRVRGILTRDPDGTRRVVWAIYRIDADGSTTATPQITDSVTYSQSQSPGTGIGFTSFGPVPLDNFQVADPIRLAGNGSAPGGITNASGTDVNAPVLGQLGLSRSVFTAASSGGSTAAKRKRTPVGTKVSFTVSEPSSVRFTVQRKARGRRSGSRCVKPTRRNRKKKGCTRWSSVRGSFSVRAKQGRNAFTFRGRMGGKALVPGSYRLVGRASDGAKNRSTLSTATFRIARR
jgi:hypothetical protein